MRLVVVGDALLDRDLDGRAERLAPDGPVPVVEGVVERPRAGGAGLAATLAAAAGHHVTLVCALGDDASGRRLPALLEAAGVAVCDLGLRGRTPEKVRVRAAGRAIVRVDAGGEPGGCGPLTDAARRALEAAEAVLASDYGRGVTAEPSVRAALGELAAGTPVVWDPHPKGAPPIRGVLLATPNQSEAARLTGASRADGSLVADEARARALAARWGASYVCVTRGADGALLIDGDAPPLAVPAPPAPGGDPCGAGDCFAATAAARLGSGELPSRAVREAVHAASAFVAAGGAAGAAPESPLRPDLSVPSEAVQGCWDELGPSVGSGALRGRGELGPSVRSGGLRGRGEIDPRGRSEGVHGWEAADPVALAERVRAAGGIVVAAGGCFDLLHAGHVAMLQAARALGDSLIACVNSDASVRRLKGADRPLVGQHDRAAVLAGLECVDAVAVFDEDDPCELLRALRPHLWAKGADYALEELAEADVIAEWGGRAVLVPYVSGRSTTRLIEEVMTRAH